MKLCITTRREGSTTVIQVDGRLVAEGVGELVRVCRSTRPPVVLDLANLLSADDLGIEVLLKERSGGASLRGCSPYVELLLQKSSQDRP